MFDLASGNYRLEVSVYDEAGKQASVFKSTFEAPSAAVPVVGDLIIVRRAEKLAPDQPVDTGNPLISKDRMLLYPEYDAGVNRGLQPDVNFVVPMVLDAGKRSARSVAGPAHLERRNARHGVAAARQGRRLRAAARDRPRAARQDPAGQVPAPGHGRVRHRRANSHSAVDGGGLISATPVAQDFSPVLQ